MFAFSRAVITAIPFVELVAVCPPCLAICGCTAPRLPTPQKSPCWQARFCTRIVTAWKPDSTTARRRRHSVQLHLIRTHDGSGTADWANQSRSRLAWSLRALRVPRVFARTEDSFGEGEHSGTPFGLFDQFATPGAFDCPGTLDAGPAVRLATARQARPATPVDAGWLHRGDDAALSDAARAGIPAGGAVTPSYTAATTADRLLSF